MINILIASCVWFWMSLKLDVSNILEFFISDKYYLVFTLYQKNIDDKPNKF